MLHPSSLIRLATLAGIALFVRAIVREAADTRRDAVLLPPPGKKVFSGRGASRGRAKART